MTFTVAFPLILMLVMYCKLRIFDANSDTSQQLKRKYSKAMFLTNDQVRNLVFSTDEYKLFEKEFGILI